MDTNPKMDARAVADALFNGNTTSVYIALAVETLRAQAQELEVQGVQLSGALKRAALLLTAKEHWRLSAVEAETQLSAIGAGGVESLRNTKFSADELMASQDDYKAWYIEAMEASNEAGFVGMSAADTIRALATTKADPAPAAPKWIDDPHDIEQGQMLNPEWSKLQSQAHPAAEPVASFDDPRVQAVYKILCSYARPPADEHWGGFTARRIVDALEAPAAPESAPWCPDVCPITGRPFFMWITYHETGVKVPTYGGPFDSYTLPVKGSDGSFECERYDHDRGGWLTDEIQDVGLKLVDDQSFIVAPDHLRYTEVEEFANGAATFAAAKPGSMIAVPFDLIASACSAIDKKRDAPKTLAELRRYTTGDLSCAALAAAPQAPAAVEPVAQDLLSHKAPWRDAIQQMATRGLTSGDDEHAYWRHELMAFDTAFDALEATAKAAPADALDAETVKKAQRYDWLRHGDNDEKVIMRGPVAHDFVYLPRNEKLDALIDAAMATQGAEPT